MAQAEGEAPGRRIEVVAHRGASDQWPEHTLAAYAQAIADGADALECDVRMSADGALVCLHDRRVDRTSNGVGPVSRLTLAELTRLDFGWRDGQPWPGLAAGAAVDPPDARGAPGVAMTADAHRVLTLPMLAELVADAGRPVTLAIEVKHPSRAGAALERQVVDVLARYGWARPVDPARARARVMSFSPLALQRVRALSPTLPLVALFGTTGMPAMDGVARSWARWWGAGSGAGGPMLFGPALDIVRARPGLVEAWHAAGHGVHVWTVNTPEDASLCASLGVDAVITDHLRQARAWLESVQT